MTPPEQIYAACQDHACSAESLALASVLDILRHPHYPSDSSSASQFLAARCVALYLRPTREVVQVHLTPVFSQYFLLDTESVTVQGVPRLTPPQARPAPTCNRAFHLFSFSTLSRAPKDARSTKPKNVLACGHGHKIGLLEESWGAQSGVFAGASESQSDE